MPALRLELRASRALTGALALVHGTGALCLVLLVPGLAGAGLAILLLALGVASARERALLRARGSLRALELGADGAATLELADGRRMAGRVHPRRHVGPWWVALSLEGALRRRFVVAGDMLEPAEFRSLRLWALWGRLPEAASPPRTA